MIKQLEEYSPEDRAFVEFVQQCRSRAPRPQNDSEPFNLKKVEELLAKIPQEDRDELFEAMQGRDR
jgi:hypothetical protein